MPNFGTNDNDRRTAEAMERIWAARRKEQVMSEVKALTDTEIADRRRRLDTLSRVLFGYFNDPKSIPSSRSSSEVAESAVEAIDALRQRAEQADASADTYALLLRKLTKDDTLLAAYRRSKNLDHRGVPVVSDVVLEMLRQEEAALGRAK